MNDARPGWFPDPFGRHDHRYWDGSAWTARVSNAGVTADDPPTASAPSAAKAEVSPRPDQAGLALASRRRVLPWLLVLACLIVGGLIAGGLLLRDHAAPKGAPPSAHEIALRLRHSHLCDHVRDSTNPATEGRWSECWSSDPDSEVSELRISSPVRESEVRQQVSEVARGCFREGGTAAYVRGDQLIVIEPYGADRIPREQWDRIARLSEGSVETLPCR